MESPVIYREESQGSSTGFVPSIHIFENYQDTWEYLCLSDFTSSKKWDMKSSSEYVQIINQAIWT